MRILIIFIYLFSFLVLCHEYEKNNIIVDHPILKINSERSKVGAGYMKIINNSTSDIYFSKISSEISKRLEIHEINVQASSLLSEFAVIPHDQSPNTDLPPGTS